jgi:protein involved in polysaccharide export with SLBB domain
MDKKFSILFLLCSALCAGQSTLTTPEPPAGVSPAQKPDANATRNLSRESVITGLATDAAGVTETSTSSKFAGPLTAKSDFQLLAEETAGRPLQVYGRRAFDQVPTTFAPIDHIAAPSDYVIGPDDELLIRAWGKIDLEARLTVDRNGQVSLPRVGTVTVAGLRYDQLENHLRSSIGNLYKDFELNVTLGRLRSIEIYVLGSARQPGAYTVSSLSTLVNALFASGGPSATGSMRHIQLRRKDRLISDFDVYMLLRYGDKSHDVHLLPGDVLYIPPVGQQIALLGSVNEPGIYEIRGDTTVATALEDAGGLTNLAGTDRVLLERVEGHRSRRVDEFGLDASGLQRLVKDGDVLRVFPLSPQFENAVTLRGNVAQPGRYAWREGMRVSDLIPNRDALITRKHWNQQNHLLQTEPAEQFGSPNHGLAERPPNNQFGKPVSGQITDLRRNPADILRGEQPGDQFDNPRDMGPADQSGRIRADQVSGDQQSRLAEQDTKATIEAVGRDSTEINWEYAVIERLDDQDLSTHLIPFRLATAIDDHGSKENKALKPGDIVTIFSRADLELPMEKHAAFVRVGGEVNAPGVYRVNPGQTLREVVEQAGGLTSHSYLYASLFTRVSARKAEEEQLKQSSEELQKDLMSKYANAIPQAGQTAADQQAQMAMQQAVLARLTSIKPTGRVVLTMKSDAASLTDIPEFPIEDGDTFYIPPRLSTVQVAGAVYNANAFRYETGKRLIGYLNDSGGATRDADQKRIFVIRADGSVVSRQSHRSHSHGNFENLKLLPGDAIVVPEKLRVSSKMTNVLQYTQLFSQLALSAAALSVVH